MGMSLPCRLFLHSYFSGSHSPQRWCSLHRPWCVDMLFRVVLSTLTCYFVWFLKCWHAARNGLQHCIWNDGLWSFFGVLILLKFCPVLLAHKDAWEMLRGVKIFLMTFMFIVFFLSCSTLDILLDVIGALDNAMGVPGFLTFLFFYFFYWPWQS
jgi:hypothetical protein